MLVACPFTSDHHKKRSLSTDSGLLLNRLHDNCRLKASSVDKYLERTKQSSNYLKLLIHCIKCQGRCNQVHCLRTCIMVTHVKQCVHAACGLKGCHTSKKLLAHYKTCAVSNQFCLMCSLVNVNVNSISSSSPTASSSKSTSTDNTYNSSPNSSEDDAGDADSCSSHSAISIFDEMIDFSKVPFRELQVSDAFHRNSCGSISGGSLATWMVYEDVNEQPPLKIRSQSLDS